MGREFQPRAQSQLSPGIANYLSVSAQLGEIDLKCFQCGQNSIFILVLPDLQIVCQLRGIRHECIFQQTGAVEVDGLGQLFDAEFAASRGRVSMGCGLGQKLVEAPNIDLSWPDQKGRLIQKLSANCPQPIKLYAIRLSKRCFSLPAGWHTLWLWAKG